MKRSRLATNEEAADALRAMRMAEKWMSRLGDRSSAPVRVLVRPAAARTGKLVSFLLLDSCEQPPPPAMIDALRTEETRIALQRASDSKVQLPPVAALLKHESGGEQDPPSPRLVPPSAPKTHAPGPQRPASSAPRDHPLPSIPASDPGIAAAAQPTASPPPDERMPALIPPASFPGDPLLQTRWPPAMVQRVHIYCQPAAPPPVPPDGHPQLVLWLDGAAPRMRDNWAIHLAVHLARSLRLPLLALWVVDADVAAAAVSRPADLGIRATRQEAISILAHLHLRAQLQQQGVPVACMVAKEAAAEAAPTWKGGPASRETAPELRAASHAQALLCWCAASGARAVICADDHDASREACRAMAAARLPCPLLAVDGESVRPLRRVSAPPDGSAAGRRQWAAATQEALPAAMQDLHWTPLPPAAFPSPELQAPLFRRPLGRGERAIFVPRVLRPHFRPAPLPALHAWATACLASLAGAQPASRGPPPPTTAPTLTPGEACAVWAAGEHSVGARTLHLVAQLRTATPQGLEEPVGELNALVRSGLLSPLRVLQLVGAAGSRALAAQLSDELLHRPSFEHALAFVHSRTLLAAAFQDWAPCRVTDAGACEALAAAPPAEALSPPAALCLSDALWGNLVPPWARATLTVHAADPRRNESPAAIDAAQTADPAWNAIHARLVCTGVLGRHAVAAWVRFLLMILPQPLLAFSTCLHYLRRADPAGADARSVAALLSAAFGLGDDPSDEEVAVLGRLPAASAV